MHKISPSAITLKVNIFIYCKMLRTLGYKPNTAYAQKKKHFHTRIKRDHSNMQTDLHQ